MKDVLAAYIKEIDYYFELLSKDYTPGLHPSLTKGGGFRINGYQSIFDNPDFPNVDWTASVIAGSRVPLVKTVEQKSAINVICVVDVTASMSFSGTVTKIREIAKFVASIGFSSYRVGDRFGLVAYGDSVVSYFEPMMARSYSLEIAEWLWTFTPTASGSRGLMEALDYLPKKPSLVFWLSDFILPREAVKRFLTAAGEEYDVVPVVFWDSAEFDNIVNWGLAWLIDPETKERRRELFTPRRREELKTAFQERRRELYDVFRTWNIDPIFAVDHFKPRDIAAFFLKRAG